MLENDKYNLK